MRANVPAYDLRRPRDLGQALEWLADPAWRPFAGGTDLMVLYEAGRLEHRRFVSLWGLPELERIEVSPEAITVGGAAAYSKIRSHAEIRRELPMLVEAAKVTGAIAIQNRGTLGGNLANASPAADSPPALLAYGAELELRSAKGARWLPVEQFFLAYRRTALEIGEIVSRIRIPRANGGSGWIHHYRKVGTRGAQAISKTCLAAAARLSQGAIAEARVALASVAPVPVRCGNFESWLKGRRPGDALAARAEGAAALARDIAPIDDIRSTREYRQAVTANLVFEFLEACARG